MKPLNIVRIAATISVLFPSTALAQYTYPYPEYPYPRPGTRPNNVPSINAVPRNRRDCTIRSSRTYDVPDMTCGACGKGGTIGRMPVPEFCTRKFREVQTDCTTYRDNQPVERVPETTTIRGKCCNPLAGSLQTGGC